MIILQTDTTSIFKEIGESLSANNKSLSNSEVELVVRLFTERSIGDTFLPTPSLSAAIEVVGAMSGYGVDRPKIEREWAVDELVYVAGSLPWMVEKTPLGIAGLICIIKRATNNKLRASSLIDAVGQVSDVIDLMSGNLRNGLLRDKSGKSLRIFNSVA